MRNTRRRTRRFAMKAATGPLMGLVLFLAGCASHATGESASDAAAPCEAYLAAYSACMQRLSPESPETANARSESARHALEAITDPAVLRKTCVNGAAQLQTSCR